MCTSCPTWACANVCGSVGTQQSSVFGSHRTQPLPLDNNQVQAFRVSLDQEHKPFGKSLSSLARNTDQVCRAASLIEVHVHMPSYIVALLCRAIARSLYNY